MDKARVRKAALDALAALEDNAPGIAREHLLFIAENTKRQRTEKDRARDKRRARPAVSPEAMKAMKDKLNSLKEGRA